MATTGLDVPQSAMADEALPAEAPAESLSSSAHPGSLLDDVGSLVEDGKTYAEAELAYQKSRLVFAGEHAKRAAILGGLAIVLVVLALVALVIGALLALVPVLGPWGATGVVVAVLAVSAGILLGLARMHGSKLIGAFAGEPE